MLVQTALSISLLRRGSLDRGVRGEGEEVGAEGGRNCRNVAKGWTFVPRLSYQSAPYGTESVIMSN